MQGWDIWFSGPAGKTGARWLMRQGLVGGEGHPGAVGAEAVLAASQPRHWLVCPGPLTRSQLGATAVANGVRLGPGMS